MPHSLTIFDYVRKSGDTMTGPLTTLALAATTGAFSDNVTLAAGKMVDGIDVSEIHQAKIKTGTYTGNGVNDRNIDIGVDLASKEYPYVIVKGAEAQKAMHRIEYGQGDLTMLFLAEVDAANLIQQFTATGFQVGDDSEVNQSGKTYRYVAIWQEP